MKLSTWLLLCLASCSTLIQVVVLTGRVVPSLSQASRANICTLSLDAACIRPRPIEKMLPAELSSDHCSCRLGPSAIAWDRKPMRSQIELEFAVSRMELVIAVVVLRKWSQIRRKDRWALRGISTGHRSLAVVQLQVTIWPPIHFRATSGGPKDPLRTELGSGQEPGIVEQAIHIDWLHDEVDMNACPILNVRGQWSSVIAKE